MISVNVNPATINVAAKVIEDKIKQAEVIISPKSMTEISKSIFTITAKRFLSDLARESIQDSGRYHHLYEWNEIGRNGRKLFLIKRSKVQYGNLVIEFVPLKSTKPVPIHPALLVPGPTGKVVTRRSVFRNKMSVMENNTPTSFVTRRTIVFLRQRTAGVKLIFVPKGKVVYSTNPGGKETTHALRNYSNYWYATKAPAIIENSRLIREIGNAVAKRINVGNSSKNDIYEVIKQVNNSYSRDLDTL
jgi:hypothetical protein